MQQEEAAGDRRVVDATGTVFIPSTRRADGTWRKEIKVRAGYVPPEEVKAFVPRAAQLGKPARPGVPVGMDPSAAAAPAPKAAPVVRGRGAASASAGSGSGSAPAAAAAAAAESDLSKAARKNAKRAEKRAAARKEAEEAKLAERLAEAVKIATTL